MSHPSSIKRKLAALLLAMPVMAAAPVIAHAEQSDETADRPVVAMGGTLAPLGGGTMGSRTRVDPLKGLLRTFGGDLGPFVGRLRTFSGDIDPMVGRLRTFEGDVDPYKGLIRTFWGDLTPTQGELDPLVGRLRTFSDEFVPQSRTILTTWQTSAASGDYSRLAAELRAMEAAAAAQWGDAVRQRTGRNFVDGFSRNFFSSWGVDIRNERSLAKLDEYERQRMLLDWYDSVLNFSGMDRVDHWMNAVNWTPALTQTQGGGSKAVIGLVDFFAARDPDISSKVVYSGGYRDVNNAHGAAVGSLIVASHDGRGIMGIAPRATIAAYNPFDHSYTASWADVTKGVTEVGKRGASVINLSLGVPGYTLPAEWRDVFRTSAINSFKDKTIYVIAAGNDGSVQTQNIEMGGALDTTFILVGSVDPNGQISAFSNQPGTACVIDGKTCKNPEKWEKNNEKFLNTDYLKESGLLMNRFLVAPGEMILVSDGEGGVTRMSGTSFAAPLVSGAIALIHDRWPWLKNYPRDVAKIILESAQDLGAPGVDPVYGHGLLDIQAAQSALDFNKLKYYSANGSEMKVNQLQRNGVQASWQANDMFFVAFEKVDTSVRDFIIPLSSRLFGSNIAGRNYQEFMYHQFVNWLNGSSFTAGPNGFTDSKAGITLETAGGWSVATRGRIDQGAGGQNGERTALRSSIEISDPARGLSFGLGTGDGALALSGSNALQMSSDYDPALGGANPLLGYASGGAHVAASVPLAPRLALAFGVTSQDRPIEADLAAMSIPAGEQSVLRLLGDYEAQAATVRVDYQPSLVTELSLSYTRLTEQGAFFGVRSLERSDFGKATVSQGLTLTGEADVGEGFRLFASGTASVSGSAGPASLDLEDTLSSAFQVGLGKQSLLGREDRLRLTLAQPLTVERGTIVSRMIGVINRETGETGVITQRHEIGAPNQRRFRVEALYGAPLPGGTGGSVNLFGSAELRDVRQDIPTYAAGGNIKLPF